MISLLSANNATSKGGWRHTSWIKKRLARSPNAGCVLGTQHKLWHRLETICVRLGAALRAGIKSKIYHGFIRLVYSALGKPDRSLLAQADQYFVDEIFGDGALATIRDQKGGSRE